MTSDTSLNYEHKEIAKLFKQKISD